MNFNWFLSSHSRDPNLPGPATMMQQRPACISKFRSNLLLLSSLPPFESNINWKNSFFSIESVTSGRDISLFQLIYHTFIRKNLVSGKRCLEFENFGRKKVDGKNILVCMGFDERWRIDREAIDAQGIRSALDGHADWIARLEIGMHDARRRARRTMQAWNSCERK